MHSNWKETARITHEGAESGTVDFGAGVRLLMEAGCDGYEVDFRRARRTYYMPGGETLELDCIPASGPVALRFDVAAIRAAIGEAQRMQPGYTYRGFCDKVTAAGCAGYLVSLPGRRVLYFGRTAETHTEYFPGSAPAIP
ncbi:MAG TPA: hypothetical protein VMH77_07610 [Steroidobacteraceae bacterium]|nr:hypothetical protein [Steroidobacteraceae bacterium]